MANETITTQNILDDAHLTELMATLRKEISDFNLLTKKTVNPDTFDSDAQWAVFHDDNWDYTTHHILNIDNKDELDDEYAALTGENSFMQQRLHALQNVTPKTKHETIRKAIEIEYITSRLDLLKTDYDNFLDTVAIDDEGLDDKWDRVREELKDEYMDEMKEEYADYAETDEKWSRSYADSWRMNEECEPDEDFVTNWLYENC